MKKTLALITLNAIILTMATPTLALQFENEEDARAYFAEVAQAFQKLRENVERGKTNSEALREAVDSVFWLHLGNIIETPILYAQNLMKEVGIPREQQIKTLEDMIREQLSIIEKNGKIATAVHVIDLLPMLEAIPNYDMLPILKECASSRNNHIRLVALGIIEKTNVPLKAGNKPDDMEKITGFVKEMEAENFENEKLRHPLQATPPPKIEDTKNLTPESSERKPTRTWLWGVGVFIAVAGGMVIFILRRVRGER